MVNRLLKPSSAIGDNANPIETNKKYEDVSNNPKNTKQKYCTTVCFFHLSMFKFITKLNIDKCLKHTPMLRKIR